MDAGCLVQRTGWTRDPDVFFLWLSAIPFTGGGFNDAAIAEGLAEALMVCMLIHLVSCLLVFCQFPFDKCMFDPDSSFIVLCLILIHPL